MGHPKIRFSGRRCHSFAPSSFHGLNISPFLQYFLPFATEGINNLIEDAILTADKLGVKVISLAALNKVKLFLVLHFFDLIARNENVET